jgi:hypothetical protein
MTVNSTPDSTSGVEEENCWLALNDGPSSKNALCLHVG